jgi:transposase
MGRDPHRTCTFSTRARYDRHLREWRHLSLGKWRVVIRANLARLECPEHGVVTEAVPWAEHDSRFTRDFEDLVAWVAREMNKTAVKNLLYVAWATGGTIIERVLARKLDRGRLERLYRIGIDEVSYLKGHRYLTVVADHETGDPVWIGERRSQATVGAFFDELGDERAKRLGAVGMDMCAPYILEARARAPQAEIAFDPFHVVKLANEAVHDVRRTEARERKGSAEAAVLKGSRWALLKAPENLRAGEHAHLSAVAGLNARVYRAYLLKEELPALYRCGPALGAGAPALVALLGQPLQPRSLREARPHAPPVPRRRPRRHPAPPLQRPDGGAQQQDRRHQAQGLRLPLLRRPCRHGLPLLHRYFHLELPI